jgi:membrane protease YdiL (CAAX protease family)
MHTLAFLSPWKRFAITGSAILVSLLLCYSFPTDARLNQSLQSVMVGIAFFLIVPVLYVKMVLKEPLGSLGFQRSHRKFGWASVILTVIPALAVLVVLVKTSSVGGQYHLPLFATQSFPLFLLYELFLVGALVFLYEVFFRGFVMLLWLKDFGFGSALFQAVFFIGSYAILRGGVSWQDVPLFFTAVISGFVAFYTKSIWYSFSASWLFLFLADAYFLAIR